MKILISGCGIAGPTLAYWLAHHGHTPVIIEYAPQLRTGGYVVDFWGRGFDVADRMGLVPRLKRTGYDIAEVRIVDARGRRVGGFDAKVFSEATDGRYTSIARGDLAAAIYGSLGDRVETLFGDSIVAIAQDDAGVDVAFEHAPSRRFDLVIGADGLHSNVRRLAFGEQARFEKPLGYTVAAFETSGYRPRDELIYMGYGLPGKQVARFSMRDDATMFLFVFASDVMPADGLPDVAESRRILHAAFDDAGWECAQILQAMEDCDTIYFDRVSQIRMDAWSSGRVALVGDAAACPSLLAGEGSALAMTEAYVLAGELHAADGDHRAAFAAYERRLRAFIDGKQRDAAKFAGSFAPRTAFGLFLRNQFSKLLAIPPLARWAMRRSLSDKFVLPEYAR